MKKLLSFLFLISGVFSFARSVEVTVPLKASGVEEMRIEAARYIAWKILQENLTPDKVPDRVNMNARLRQIVTGVTMEKVPDAPGFYHVKAEVDVSLLTQHGFLQWKTFPVDQEKIKSFLAHRKKLAGCVAGLASALQDRHQVYSGIRKGNFEVSASDSAGSNSAKLRMNFVMRFDREKYCLLEKNIQKILRECAVAADSGRCDHDKFFDTYDGLLAQFNRKNSTKGDGAVVFQYSPDASARDHFSVYIIPGAVFRKLKNLLQSDHDDKSILQFEFKRGENSDPLYRQSKQEIRFFSFKDGNYYGKCDVIIFNGNEMYMSGNWFAEREFSWDFDFSIEEIRQMQECIIEVTAP